MSIKEKRKDYTCLYLYHIPYFLKYLCTLSGINKKITQTQRLLIEKLNLFRTNLIHITSCGLSHIIPPISQPTFQEWKQLVHEPLWVVRVHPMTRVGDILKFGCRKMLSNGVVRLTRNVTGFLAAQEPVPPLCDH